MIAIDTDKIYSVYVRTNRRVHWRYAEYGGRYRTAEEAIEKIQERYTDNVEYLIEDLDGNVAVTGFVSVREASI